MVSARILRTETLRSSAIGVGLVVVLATAAMLYVPGPWNTQGFEWNEHWAHLAPWYRHLLAFLLPIAVVGGAVQGLRERRPALRELFESTPRPQWHRALHTAVVLAAALVATCACYFLVGGVQVWATTGEVQLDWLHVAAVGGLSLVAAAWLGMGLTRFLPARLTAVVATVAVFVALVAAMPGASDGIPTQVGLLSPLLLGVTEVSAVQALWFTGVAVAGLLLSALRGSVTLRGVVALAVLLVVLVAALTLFPSDPDRTYVPSTSPAQVDGFTG